jgi:hypothetical protein
MRLTLILLALGRWEMTGLDDDMQTILKAEQ